MELNRTKTTDRTGAYSVKRLDTINCTLHVRAIGFDAAELPVELIKGKLKEKVDFKMSPVVEVLIPANA